MSFLEFNSALTKDELKDHLEDVVGIPINFVTEGDNYELKIIFNASSAFDIREFPGNCSWLIVYNLYNDKAENDKAECGNLLKISIEIARVCGYANIFLSVNNLRDRELFEKLGCTCIHNNINYHSKNRVYLLTHSIESDNEEDNDDEYYNEDEEEISVDDPN